MKHWNIGEGTINWNRFIQNFPKDYYKGNLSLEVCQKEKILEERFLKEAYETIHKIGERIENI